MTVAADDLRRLMRNWATGVTLVTTSLDGSPHGMTVSSFTSISLTPPLILVSLANDARTRQMIMQTERFAVAILSQEQQELADRFAGRVADRDDRFQDVEYGLSPLANPIPRGALAYLDCALAQSYEIATHSLLIGEVRSLDLLSDSAPLLYFDRDYRSFGDSE